MEVESLPSVDRYMLRQHASFLEASREAYESFQFFRLYQSLQGWCSTDLSTFYLDVSKDRLYLSARDSFDRRACQTTIVSNDLMFPVVGAVDAAGRTTLPPLGVCSGT